MGQLAITFPSVPAAISTGLVVMPLYVLGLNEILHKFAEREGLRFVLSVVWMVFGFFFLFCTRRRILPAGEGACAGPGR